MKWKITTFLLFLALFFICSIATAQKKSEAKLIKTNLAPHQVQMHTKRHAKTVQETVTEKKLKASPQQSTMRTPERKALMQKLEAWLATGKGTASERQRVQAKLAELRTEPRTSH
ncbi:MAG: hypothetical protein AAF206_10505 [Bacteroidota bacterium]